MNSFWYVYVLRSKSDGKLYIGKTRDLRLRFVKHNSGQVVSTKARRPFELLCYEAYRSKTDCGREELFLKSGIGRESLKHRLKYTLGEV